MPWAADTKRFRNEEVPACVRELRLATSGPRLRCRRRSAHPNHLFSDLKLCAVFHVPYVFLVNFCDVMLQYRPDRLIYSSIRKRKTAPREISESILLRADRVIEWRLNIAAIAAVPRMSAFGSSG